MSRVKLYILNVLTAIDQLFMALLGFDPDETASSYIGKHYPNTWAEKAINKIFFWQDNHCQQHREEDEGKDSLWKLKK